MPPDASKGTNGATDKDGLRKRATASEPANGAEASFTWQQVAEHNNEESAWVIVDDGVYDLTSWLDNHPGGREMLLLMAGRDASAAFATYHPFTDKPKQILHKFKVGKVTTFEFPRYAPDTNGFYAELCAKVGAYFQETGLDPKSPWPCAWRMFLVTLVGAAAFLITNGFWAGIPMYARIAAAVLFGVCQALPLLHIMHDSSHTAFGRKQAFWTFGGRLYMDYLAGANLTSWHYQHVVGHHIYTNVFLADPDLPVTKAGDPRRLVQRQKYSSMYAWQHMYLPPLYGILGLKFRIQDFTETFFRARNGPVRVNPISPWRWFELFFSKAVWASWRIVWPLLCFNTGGAVTFWALFLLSEWMTGYFLAFNFQVSHVSTECDYPLGADASDRIADPWAVSQVKSSVDYSHGNWLTTFMSGALNYQVTHHLFPGVSQYHYPAIAPIIKQVCQKHKVHYPCLPDFLSAFWAHVRHLRNLGMQGVPAEFHMG